MKQSKSNVMILIISQIQLWLQQCGCRAMRRNKKVCVCRVIYNSFERGSTNQNQGPELSVLNVFKGAIF